MNRLRVTCSRPGTEGQKSVCEIEFRRARSGISWASTPGSQIDCVVVFFVVVFSV